MLNQIQLIVLIPMIGAFVPLDVIQIITGLNFSLFNFDFINWSSFTSSQSFISRISYDQPDTYLQLLSIDDGSAIINIYSSIGVSLIIPLFHLLFCILYCFCINVDNTNKCKKIVSKFLEWVCFGWYIRYIMEAYLLMLISSLTEIYRNDTSIKSKSTSFGFAAAILSFLGVCILCSIVLAVIACPSKTKSRITNRWCHQCFSDSKDFCLPRLMPILFFLRRVVLCLIVIIFKQVQFKTKLIYFVSFQSSYILLILLIRPFEKIKDSILEILNEVFYLLLCCLLFKFNIENDWTSSITQIYIWVIISNNILFCIISFFGLIINKVFKKKIRASPKPSIQEMIQSKYRTQSETPQNYSPNFNNSEAKEIENRDAKNKDKNIPGEESINNTSMISFDRIESKKKTIDSKMIKKTFNREDFIFIPRRHIRNHKV